jgi:GR25 family glycosyltransferase involved in LPS biosynthesis
MQNDFACPKFYCVTYNNPERRERMANRFATLGLDFAFVESLPWDHPSIKPPASVIEYAKEFRHWSHYAWSTAHGHGAAIQHFIDSGDPIGVICEDDIHLYRWTKEELPIIVGNMNKLSLDCVLLGYLTTNPPAKIHSTWYPILTQFMYFHCAFDLWGAQMYIITREYALNAIARFGPKTGYAVQSVLDKNLTPFVADWIWNKASDRRAIISPMIAVEEGKIQSTENTFGHYHAQCFDINYNPNLYI